MGVSYLRAHLDKGVGNGMKILHSATREYQLVSSTRKKDVDGTIYLVAGEKDLWVKILNNRSAQTEKLVEEYIQTGIGSFFDTPVEIVRDGSKFMGYSFHGQEMKVVPITEPSQPSSAPSAPKGKVKPDSLIVLVVTVISVLLFALNYIHFNRVFLNIVNKKCVEMVYQGCSLLSVHGVLGGIAGIAAVYFGLLKDGRVPEKGESRRDELIAYIAIGIVLFILGVVIGDMAITLVVRGIVSIISAF